MKFAFSNVGCPTWDFETIVAKAKELGYDGVEIRGFLNETILTAANVFLTDPEKVRQTFAAGGVQIACLASSIAYSGSKKADRQLAADAVRYIDTAKALGCPLVRIFDTQVPPGRAREKAVAGLAGWLSPLADYAAERGVSILIENALSFRNAKELWNVLETLNHPAVAVCWDVCNAALIGEQPAISVPTLNNRIRYVQVKDAKFSPQGATFCKLGEGDVRVQDLCRRLMGIGYGGWVCVEWEKAWLANLAEPDEIFPDSITKLRQWTQPPAKEEEKKKPEPKKPEPKKPAAAATTA